MPQRIFVLGASGTIGQAAVRELVQRGHEVLCFVRPRAGVAGRLAPDDTARLLPGAALRLGDVCAPASLARDGLRGEPFDALMSCLASRTGAPRDAWAIDRQAHLHALAAALAAGAGHFVLLSALCVQKAVACLPAGQAGLREGAGRIRPALVDRAAHGLLQIAVGAGRTGSAAASRGKLSNQRGGHAVF